MSKYYGFTPETIQNMTLKQFSNYMTNIAEIEKMMHGDSKDEVDADLKSLLEEAGKLGIKPPEYIKI